MTLSSQLNKELNQEFDPTAHIARKHIYGSNKRRLQIKKQAQAAKIVKEL
jgi:hypothetical protein